MACKISWTLKAWQSYEANIKYLQEAWSEKEISKFILLAEKKLSTLANHPKAGSSRNKKNINIRYTLVHKRVALIYRHKPSKNEIELLLFWNTYQNPRKLNLK